MMNMVIERLKDQVQLFATPLPLDKVG